MRLYHGSNITVEHPVIREKLRALDFGAGFYLTSSLQQAVKWAKTVTRRRRKGDATLNIYEMNERELIALKVMRFETANADWLEFIVKNRKEMILGEVL